MQQQAIAPLRSIFWGSLLCSAGLIIKFEEQGFQVDILNDALGRILIVVGVFRLSAIPVHNGSAAEVDSRYATVMKFVQVASILAVLSAIRDHAGAGGEESIRGNSCCPPSSHRRCLFQV